MRYHALATDYDGTIATHGYVPTETVDAMRQLKRSGRKLILVTGRELTDLFSVFPCPEIFDRIVAENGALVYRPDTKEERIVGEAPKRAFVDLLRQRGVTPLSVGRVIVATTEPNETWVLQAIRDLGLELQVIFNKGAVMILPSGVNKATGLEAALSELRLSRHNVVCVGDAENDHAFLEYGECSAAVANALPALKDRADIVLSQTHGAGVNELIQQLLADDLQGAAAKLIRHEILLGISSDGQEVRIPPCGKNLLIAGTSEESRSRLVCRFLERLLQQQYQACLIDPRGEFSEMKPAMVFGDSRRPPTLEGVMQGLDQPKGSVVVNLAAILAPERPAFFRRLLDKLRELRLQTGRPHWILVDEAESVLSPSPASKDGDWPDGLSNGLLLSAHPKDLTPAVINALDLAIAVAESPEETLAELWAKIPLTSAPQFGDSGAGELLGWRRGEPAAFSLRPGESKSETERRHVVAG